jgi:ankyrin repeat protein
VDGFTPLALSLFYAHVEAAAALQAPRCPDNLRIAAALGDLDRMDAFFDAAGGLDPSAGVGRAFGFPLPAFPPWSPGAERQEILDEALAWAARNGQIAAVAALVTRGADVNANVARGTALLWACYADRVEVAEWLLDHGADADLRHDFGGAEHGRAATAMHLAAQYGAHGCLRLLLARGADATVRDALYGGTPHGWARFAGDAESVRILEAAGHALG